MKRVLFGEEKKITTRFVVQWNQKDKFFAYYFKRANQNYRLIWIICKKFLQFIFLLAKKSRDLIKFYAITIHSISETLTHEWTLLWLTVCHMMFIWKCCCCCDVGFGYARNKTGLLQTQLHLKNNKSPSFILSRHISCRYNISRYIFLL